MAKKRGIWICVTGIDGVGKTTLCKYLINILPKSSKFMKLPHFEWVREMIKISGRNSPTKDKHTDSLIFSASNCLEMYLIDDFIKQYKFLITQRCWLDYFPYRKTQGISLKKGFSLLKPETFRKPDVVFFLKCDYRTAYDRIKNQNGDKYERLNFMKVLENEFENMFYQIKTKKFPLKFPKTRIVTIDATKSLNELKKELKNHLIKLGIISGCDYCSGP